MLRSSVLSVFETLTTSYVADRTGQTANPVAMVGF